ncbi:MAG TPA: hypothetical protein VME22_01580 [Solirubrobacteraceae bacterium]|nr:hypothetical protein [Solirubrobacteraceae bacterium]
MADRGATEDPGVIGASPVLVRVTVEPGPRRGVAFRQIRRLGRVAPVAAVVAVALFAAAVVGVVATQVTATAPPRPGAQAAQASNPGPVGVAAAYRYPRACLSVTIAAADPAYAAVRLNRASPCWRYGVYVTAIFHRVAGVWRMVLDTAGARCPMTSLPPAVRAQLGLCDSDRAATAAG